MKRYIIKHKIRTLYIAKYLVYLLIIASSIFNLVSCEDFVEVEPPQTDITGDIVFKERGTAYAALSNVYTKIKDNSVIHGGLSGAGFLMSLYTDDADYFGSFGSSTESFYNNSLIPSVTGVLNFWSSSYNIIYETNALIEGVNSSTYIDESDKNQIKGEALFLRSLIHFYLVNLYGDIPYVTSTDHQINSVISKTTVQDAYLQIVSDLQNAKLLLSDTYVAGERIRPNRGTVSAFLARVYLYLEDWDNALSESSTVIANTGQYILEIDVNNVFLKESMEAIWQLKPTNEGDPAHEAVAYQFSSSPNNYALSNYLIDSFEPEDTRLLNWVTTNIVDSNTWYRAYKYKENIDGSNFSEYSAVFRLAEQYLIRAEARTQLGDISGAQADINMIRNRAGLFNTTAASTSDLINAIVQERRLELFSEFGHRFFDLKRLGLLDTVLDPVKPGWDTTDALLPIPESELLVNPNLLPQNPGY